MKLMNKLVNASILLVALVLLFSTIAYAKPFTDAFTGGLKQINDFFAQEQYKPYSQVIDFFFFSLLFIAVYMAGVRYAFKEVKRAEQVIAILLGLLTAFLMVIGGFSITALLPFVNWLLYFLLFVLFWWLLKGIKSKFWRFILAVLLTLLTIALVQGLFMALAPPEVRGPDVGFLRSFAESLKSIDFSGVTPRVPGQVSDLFGAPTIVTTPETKIVEVSEPEKKKEPAAVTPGRGGLFGTGIPVWAVLLAVLALAVVALRKRLFGKGERAPGEPGEEQPPQEVQQLEAIITQIDGIIGEKQAKIREITDAKRLRHMYLEDEQKTDMFLNHLTQVEGAGGIWTDEGRSQLRREWEDIREIVEIEESLIHNLVELKIIEQGLFNNLNEWGRSIDIGQEIQNFNVLIYGVIRNYRDINNIGILQLIVICYDVEKRERVLEQELSELLQEDNIEGLVKGKFETVHRMSDRLTQMNQQEERLITLLENKISEQIRSLEALQERIRQMIEQARAQARGQRQPSGGGAAGGARSLTQDFLVTLTPQNSEHAGQIRILSRYHTETQEELTIGKGKSIIKLADSNINDEFQAFIAFDEATQRFVIIKAPKSQETKIVKNNKEISIDYLNDGDTIIINGYIFNIAIRPPTPQDTLLSKEGYMNQLKRTLRIKA